MSLASVHESAILGTLFLRRGRAVNRILALATGAVVTGALLGLFGLTRFMEHVGNTGDQRALGVERAGGCIQGDFRYDSLDLEQYENVLLAATCPDPAVPPGLTHFPQPGQVYLSPTLAKLRSNDSRIAARYPHVDGLIGRTGLLGSNELRAIIGVAPRPDGTLGVSTFDTFGSPDSVYLPTYLRMSIESLLVLGLFFTIPAAAFLIAASTRLNARVRERQLGLLAIIGVQARVLRRALMLESAVLVGFGAVAGLVLSLLTYPHLTPHFAAWTAFPGDFAAPWPSYVIVFALVLGTAIVAAWWGANTRRHRPGVGLLGRAPRRLAWRWALLAAGLVLAAASTRWPGSQKLVLGGRFVTVAGLFAAAAPVCAFAGRRLSESGASLVWLAGARLRRPSGALTRSLAALIAGLFVLSVGATTIQARSQDPAAIQRAQSPDGYSVVEVERPSPAVRFALSSYQVLSGRSSTDGGGAGTLAGPCTVIGEVIGNNRFTCSSSPMVGVSDGSRSTPAGTAATPRLFNGPRADSLTGYVLNATDRSAIQPDDDIILIPLPTAESDALYDRLVGQDPLTNVRIHGSGTVSGASQLAGILDVFRWGALFAVMISLISALISLVSLMNDRRAGNNYLQILGLTPRRAAAVTLIEVTAAVGSCAALAFVSSWLWALNFRSPASPLSMLSLATPFAVATLALVAAAGAVVWNSLRTAGVTVVPDRDNLASAHDTFATRTAPKAT